MTSHRDDVFAPFFKWLLNRADGIGLIIFETYQQIQELTDCCWGSSCGRSYYAGLEAIDPGHQVEEYDRPYALKA